MSRPPVPCPSNAMSLPRRCEDRSCQRPWPYVRGQPPGVLTFCMFRSLSVSHMLMCTVFLYGRTWVAWKRQDRPFGWSVLCHGFSLLTCLRPSFLAGLWRWVQQLSHWPPGPQWECSVGALWPLLRCPPNSTLINCEDCTSWAVLWTLTSSQSRGQRTFFLPL